MPHLFSKPYKGQLHLVLRLRSIFILTNLEVTNFISLLVRCNHIKSIMKIVLLKIFCGKIFQIPFRELFLRNNCDFILEAFNGNDIPKISSFSIDFNLLSWKLFKISRIKLLSSTGWVRSTLNFQVDFLGFCGGTTWRLAGQLERDWLTHLREN